MRLRLTVVLAVAASLGCDSSTSPFDVVASDVVRSELTISPPAVTAGEVVTLRVATTNSGSARVSASNGCAEGLGFRIKRPDGEIVDPYAGLAWICPRLDSQDLDPGETDVVSWQWKTPGLTGDYEVIGGLVVDGRIVGPSPVVSLRVR